jgi:hypothetical protein
MPNPTPGGANRIVVNTPPTLSPVGDQVANLGFMLFVTNSAQDAEQQAGLQILTFHLLSPPRGAAMNPATGVFAWAPAPDQATGSNYTINVWVEDNGLPRLSATNTFHVVVPAANTAPVIGPISDQTVSLGQTVSFTVSATDGQSPPQILTFSLDPGAPAGASIDPVSGAFTWTPAAEQVPSVNPITVRVQDNGSPALSSTRTFTVYAVTGNTAPVLGTIADKSVLVGQTVSFTVSATDVESPPQILSFTLEPGAPADASLNASSGLFSWTPTNAPSTNQFTVRVADNGTPPLSATGSFTVTVSPLRLSVGINTAGTTISISSQVVAGRHYRLDVAETLATSGSWQAVPGYEDVLANTGNLNIDLSTTGTNRFYRLVLLP